MKKVIFVAEIGMNHDGNFDLAYELIRQAKHAGADIAKFQFGWRDKPGEINCIDLERARKLKDWCDEWEIEMMTSLITEEGLKLAQEIGLNRYKIASRTVVDKPALCQKILALGKETFVSLGMWNEKDFPFGLPHAKLRYIFCRSQYPSYAKDLAAFPEKFSEKAYFGYSDHMHGIEGCLLSLSRGALFVEKHFTLNKTSQVIRDHVLSATPEDFRQLTIWGRPLARLAARITGGKHMPSSPQHHLEKGFQTPSPLARESGDGG